MSRNIEEMIRTHLVGIIVIVGLVGCAGSTKAPPAGVALEPSEISPKGAGTTAEWVSEDAESAARETPLRRQPKYLVHTVRWSGESLSIIAKWYTGQFKNWKILANFNSKLKPDRIFVGQTIRVPEALLRTRDRMPRSFVAQFARKPKKKTSRLAKGDKDLPLFGPRDYSGK